MMEDKSFAFVCGLHRSGTSLLFKILRDHAEISGFSETGVPEDEGQHLQSVYPTAKAYGGPGKFGFDTRSRLDESSQLATPENAARLYREWSLHWDTSAALLLEKSPPNLIRTRFLQALFPRSSFLTILRHPLAVAYATQKWSLTSVASLVEHWLLCHEAFERDAGRLDRVLSIRYEDFVATPQPLLVRICEFLGVAPTTLHHRVRTDINAKYFARWLKLRDGLRRGYAQKIVDRFGERVLRFGYRLDEPEILEEPLLPLPSTRFSAEAPAADTPSTDAVAATSSVAEPSPP